MTVPNELILVSKQSILKKHFGINLEEFEKLKESEKEEVRKFFPTEDEAKFMEIFKSDIPQLARLQKKMSVCLDVEVIEYDFHFVKFEYSGSVYQILAPKNAYRVCKALDKDSLEGLNDLCQQGCVSKNGKNIENIKIENILEIEEIQILKQVAEKFFFQTFLI